MKLKELFDSIPETLTEASFFETKATGEFTDSPEMKAAMGEHYALLRENGKQIGTAAYKYPVTQVKLPNGVYIVGLYYRKLIAAFCKYRLLQLGNKKYIDVILMHGLSSRSQEHKQLKYLVGKNLIMTLLGFMKGHYKLPFIEGHGEQSDDAIRAIRIASRDHNTYWLNIKTGETAKYDAAGDNPKQGKFNEPFRSTERKTDWRIVVESSGTHEIDDYEIHDTYMAMLKRGLK